MKILKIFTAVLLMGLASCQTIPTERTNNCACAWEKPTKAGQFKSSNKRVLA
jgi:hypothetical protein